MDFRATAVLEYWFEGIDLANPTLEGFKACTKHWFRRDEAVDQYIREHFTDDVTRAARGEYDAWAGSAAGRLSLIVLLDQFPRNMHRDSPLAFAYDARSYELARSGVDGGMDTQLSAAERFVFYMPLMHSEDIDVQRFSLTKYAELCEVAPPELRPELQVGFDFAKQHHDCIVRFSRFPYRNRVLGRESTAEEIEFLK